MKKTITLVVLFVAGISFAQSQFEQGMRKAIGLWKDGKTNEASDLFERIAAAEKNSWLPNYYVALVNTTAAFGIQDKDKMSALLNKSQKALDIEMGKDQKNAELYVMQALINTAWIVFDPMTNGMKLSGPTMEMYGKAEAIAPNNPRVVFGKAEFQMGGAKWTGIDTKPLCKEMQRSIDLFKNEKPETPFHPSWGLERAVQAAATCK